MSTDIRLEVDTLSTFSLAAQKNAYRIIKSLRIEYLEVMVGDEQEPTTDTQAIKGIKVLLKPVTNWLEGDQWLVDELSPGQSLSLQRKDLKLPFESLFGLTEEFQIDLQFEVYSDTGELLASLTKPITLLPANYWGGEIRQSDLLAAFVMPNGLYVESLLKSAADLLESNGLGRSLDGYQSNTRERPYMMLAALWSVVCSQQLAYVSPPVGFAKSGQRIRLASDISSSKISACLDTSLLFASCIEAMGLNPVVAITEGHAFAGAWLINERLPVLTNDDPMDIRKRVDNRDIVLFETTLVTSSTPITLEQAAETARSHIAEDKEHEFVMVIDVAQARARQIKPLSTVEERRVETTADAAAPIVLSKAPPLPPVRADERVIEETPETRIDSWSRKLLDLTKRNSLLNFRDRAVAITLFCPDIGAMEDELADGGRFTFISAEESPLNDKERDAENFRMKFGSDIHQQYAIDQLRKRVLIANQNQRRLESNAVSLLRKAKNDLEEGGSNTLFLALGMLKWKENPEDDRSYRAPLILIPVQLSRKSARAPIVLTQLQDEDPIFNLTLIEFLQTEHDINLSEFKQELPEDESGVDVAGVWQRVRDAVNSQRGFEVVEELVLSSFSFAKYLMWKDLRERLDDLKENPFVSHLVDSPREPYGQVSEFIERNQVDEKIDPATVFTPLNCDSSQLVAVEASGRNQDFVLEGPPGTGKSETIANMIAHNIGKGRKVLFVAEKMAALNVVFRRLQKIGLDHLCLELHSNKANKRAVLDQLNNAWQKRNGLDANQWYERVNQLKEHRDTLNTYVRALHAKTPYGLTARDTTAHIAARGNDAALKLDWPMELSFCPIQSVEQYESLQQLIQKLALAYGDLKGVDPHVFAPLTHTRWSNAWQVQLLEELGRFQAVLPKLAQAASQWLNALGVQKTDIATVHFKPVLALAQLIDLAVSHAIDFAVLKGGKERLQLLEDVISKKEALDKALSVCTQKISYEKLKSLPLKRWQQLKSEAKSGWIKGFLRSRTLNKEALQHDLEKFESLDEIDRLARARDLRDELEPLIKDFEQAGIWKGWLTTPEELSKALNVGVQARELLGEIIQLSGDPAVVMGVINKWMIDGRDYLENSKIFSHKQQFIQIHSTFCNQREALHELGFDFTDQTSLKRIAQSIDGLQKSQTKLKSWCEWVNEKSSAQRVKLGCVTQALETGQVQPENVQEDFYTAYCAWLAPLLIDKNAELREFKASNHEATIERFRKLDAEVAAITSEYVTALASTDLVAKDATFNPPEFGTLSREIQKKTRHIPIRSLFEQMGSSLLTLCPCLMMSPLSVAQFLPANFKGFDLVIFDEASQMTTWDSVGAIARGRNVIVVGDPKQMPPTNFFSASSSSDDPEEEDLESILDQALAARLPLKRLMGHYRSRHETLIAFSNSKYYENSLVTFPSSDTKESAVSLHRVNGVYAKGQGRNNPIEAKAVVDEIVRRLRHPLHRSKSIGVVTLNTDQQRTIEDLLDAARRDYPDIEPFFHSTDTYDGVFVKNLESVQGDERDIIMLSLGYGPVEPEAKTMSMNFGPLNKTGGERRLNVAITRATTEVLLFSSFDSSMIDLSRTSSKAVEDLKHYLEFAERGPRALAEQTHAAYGIDQFDSDFEQFVAWSLREKGWQVQTQVGVSKFRVDLGIVHPDAPGRYLAGVECDGATYHSAPTARDRDRVRHAVLENLGWRIIRLWSTDYFVDPVAAIDRIDDQLRVLLAKDQENQAANQKNQLTLDEIQADACVAEQEYAASTSMSSVAELPAETLERSVAENEVLDYFAEENKGNISRLCKEILQEKPGITLQSLALDVALAHNLKRTSKKQIEHLLVIIKPWVGIKEFRAQPPVVWPSPDVIQDEIPWRGLSAFGYDRAWTEIAYPEALGLARVAKKMAPDDPITYICEELKIKRRHEKTIETFKSWVAEVNI